MKSVGLSKDRIVPATAVFAVTDTLNLLGFRPPIESLALLFAVVTFGTFAIGVVGDELIETIESQSVRVL